MVWVHNKINRDCKFLQNTVQVGKTDTETEKEMGRQYNGMDMFKVG